MIFSLSMMDNPESFLSLSTWKFLGGQVEGKVIQFGFCCQKSKVISRLVAFGLTNLVFELIGTWLGLSLVVWGQGLTKICVDSRHSKGYPTSAKVHFSQCYNLKWFNLSCTRLMANCIHNTDWWYHGPSLSFSKIMKNSKLHQATAENIEWPEWPGPDLMILL